MPWQPMPRLVQKPLAGSFLSASDLFAYKKDRKSKVISFVVHAVVIGGVLWWGMMAQQMTPANDTVITPVKLTLYDPPPPVMPVAKVVGGGGGGGAHRVVPPVKAPPPRVHTVHMLLRKSPW